MEHNIRIIEFSNSHQPGIDLLMQGIQDEYSEQIYGPASKTIAAVAQEENRKYWVALDGNKVIGTVGIVLLADNNIVLKSMMLHKAYRGKKVADRLLDITLQYGITNGMKTMYLGTMAQFTAAIAFYLKKGFTEILTTDLPHDFTGNPVDTVFFRLAF